jgi:uncharacterized protein
VPLLAVSAHDIDAAGLPLEADLPLVWLEEVLRDAALEGAAPGRVEVRLSRTGKDIVVRGRIKADLRTPCARCLDPVPVAIDTELSLLLQPAATAHVHGPHRLQVKPKPGAHANGSDKLRADKPKVVQSDDDGYVFSAEEADTDTFDGETVVLDPFVREAILLEVPNFPLCSDACPGIRPASMDAAPEEAGPRIDPRLAPLSALRDKLQAARRPSKPPPAAETKTKTAPTRERSPAANPAGKKTKKDKE